MPFILILLICSLSPRLRAEEADPGGATPVRAKRPISLTLQTGFADTFQLTLGGVFGEGPAWQNRVTLGVGEVFRKGDSVTVSGWNTHDIPSHANDWLAGVSYRSRVINKSRHVLHLSAGAQRWRLPSVKTGAQDWLGSWQLQYQTRVKRLPIMLLQDSWTLFHSPLPKGTLLFNQLYTEHPLFERAKWKLIFRHGPQYTYSWNFYGTNGHRVIRYATFGLLSWNKNTLEVGYRQQFGLQPPIPDNRFWHVLLSRTF